MWQGLAEWPTYRMGVWKLAENNGTGGNGKDIYSVDFTDYLPGALRHDPKMKALAAAMAGQMLGVGEEIRKALIYPRIGELPEELVDILAYDFHIDWYDYSYPLNVKRDILKNGMRVHKKMGTKYAVETALRDVYKSARVEEWFEYGGEPYMFRVIIDVSVDGLTDEAKRKLEGKMRHYKNLRSQCENFIYRVGDRKGMARTAQYAGMGMSLTVMPFGL